MPRTNFQELLDAGVHFGHLARKWNPKMAPYIFDQKNGIHIIDLHKSIVKIDEAANVLKQLARSGRKVLFVATKKQAKEIVAEKAASVNMPYVTERWPGGMLCVGSYLMIAETAENPGDRPSRYSGLKKRAPQAKATA